MHIMSNEEANALPRIPQQFHCASLRASKKTIDKELQKIQVCYLVDRVRDLFFCSEFTQYFYSFRYVEYGIIEGVKIYRTNRIDFAIQLL